MMCDIVIEGHLPRLFKMSKSSLREAAEFFALRSSKRVGIPFRSVTVVLQNDSESDAVHREIMDVEGATDVITQAYEAMPPEPEGIYGELYVNTDQAVRFSAIAKNWSAAKELLLYVAHGMDHLSGADDFDPADRVRMRRRELKWIRDYVQLKSGKEY